MGVNDFFILGNGGGGTSLLRGLLNAHSRLNVDFEYFNKANMTPEFQIKEWLDKKIVGNRWANKVPIEQFKTSNWTDKQILEIGKHFLVIWMIRRFSKYYHPDFNTEEAYKEYWDWSRDLYWKFKEQNPAGVIQVSFEDLVLRPKAELKRICAFLEVDYELGMLDGTLNTGKSNANQVGFNLEKV